MFSCVAGGRISQQRSHRKEKLEEWRVEREVWHLSTLVGLVFQIKKIRKLPHVQSVQLLSRV